MRYISATEAKQALAAVLDAAQPRDDKFLEVAVNGRADLILSGDRDPLDLNPFLGVAIFSPAAYLAR
jgi:uncharacterized protein